MGKFIVLLTEQSKRDLAKHKKAGNKAAASKIKKILDELADSPYTGTGQPEQLKHQLSGYWSRRINKKDRIVYAVEEKIVTVTVVSVMGHYADK